MSGYKQQTPADRQTAAANAKKAMLERFRARPPADDPAVQQRLAAQKAIIEAREARAAQRKAAQEAEAARLAAEEAARVAEQERLAAEAAVQAKRMAEEAALAEMDYKQRALALAAEQKALRDARYARRKAR